MASLPPTGASFAASVAAERAVELAVDDRRLRELEEQGALVFGIGGFEDRLKAREAIIAIGDAQPGNGRGKALAKILGIYGGAEAAEILARQELEPIEIAGLGDQKHLSAQGGFLHQRAGHQEAGVIEQMDGSAKIFAGNEAGLDEGHPCTGRCRQGPGIRRQQALAGLVLPVFDMASAPAARSPLTAIGGVRATRARISLGLPPDSV